MSDIAQSNRILAAYRGTRAGRSYEMWREDLCRGFCRMDVEPSQDDRIDCEVNITMVASLSLARPTGISGRFSRTRELLSDGHDDFLLFSAVKGPVQITQGQKHIVLTQGQKCLASMDDIVTVALQNTNEFTTTRIPRRQVLEISPYAEDMFHRPLAGNPALQTMLDRYFELCMNLAPDLDAVGQQRTAQHLIDLTGLLLGTTSESAEIASRRGYSAARFDLIKAEILRNLHRADLTTDTVARMHRLSLRQIQRGFSHSGTTFTEFVLEERLLLAHRLLSDPRFRHRKVSDIAYSVGFGDLSYFNREFRRRFGDTPTAIRGG
jgi:AraC-like DNA-binding protein